MPEQKIGVLVMSYGTPESMEQIEGYYTHIRHGRPPTAEQLAELKGRYEAIGGGVFPLRQNTDRQVAELERTINRLRPGVRFVCYQGMKHARPFVEDGVRRMAEDGIREAVGIVLAPHYSAMSIGEYVRRAREAAQQCSLSLRFVLSYHLHPKLIEAFAARVNAALRKFIDGPGAVKVVFTAHSLPEKILEWKDPYPEQLKATARAIAERTGLTDWMLGWQSAGKSDIPWLGPDILDILRSIRNEGGRNVLVCPIGFVSDHLEILYDLDIEAKALAGELGLHFERTESLNTDPLYMETLSEAVLAELERPEQG